MSTTIGTTLSKAWPDGSGAVNQSHLVYAVNADVWWLFSLDSTKDVARTNHTIHAYYSSGPDLTTATWTAASDVPEFAANDSSTDQILGGGRSLAVLYLKNGATDVVHLRASIAQDGQAGDNNHLRGTLGKTSITWGSWVQITSPAASQWKGPAGTGASGAAGNGSWCDVLGISVGGFLHSFSGAQDFEIDMNALASANPDTGATWTNDWNIITTCGPGGNVAPMCLGKGTSGGNRPASATIDGTMPNQCKMAAFAQLPGEEMLAVYSNGGVAQPSVSNLRSQKSLPSSTGMWIDQNPVSTTYAVDPDGQDMGPAAANNGVFAADLTHHQNDWTLVQVDAARIFVFRRASATQIDAVQFGQSPTVVAGGAKKNLIIADKLAWKALAAQPPALTGKTIKAPTTNAAGLDVAGGIFGATNGVDVWLFIIDTTDNAIKYTRYDVSAGAWDAWATLTSVAANAAFVSGYPRVASNQIGVVWTEPNSTNYDTKVTSLRVSFEAPAGTALRALAHRAKRRRFGPHAMGA